MSPDELNTKRLQWLLEHCASFTINDWSTGDRDVYTIDATTEAIDKAMNPIK